MKKLFKHLISAACFFAIVACTFICTYEVYNSFLSSDPRNIEIYHQMASEKSDFFATYDKASPEIATPDSATPDVATEDTATVEDAEIATEDTASTEIAETDSK